MFQSFTGSARQTRQVNLSGQRNSNRNNNLGRGGGADQNRNGGNNTNTTASHGFSFGLAGTAQPTARRGASTLSSGGQAAVAQAQIQRAQREQQRERHHAVHVLQCNWRGYIGRKKARKEWRSLWDSCELGRMEREDTGRDGDVVMNEDGEEEVENESGGTRLEKIERLMSQSTVPIPSSNDAGDVRGRIVRAYTSAEEGDQQLRLLVQFVEVENATDLARLAYFGRCLEATVLNDSGIPKTTLMTDDARVWLLYRLSERTLDALSLLADGRSKASAAHPSLPHELLSLLLLLTKLIPKAMTRDAAKHYYSVLARLSSLLPASSSSSSSFPSAGLPEPTHHAIMPKMLTESVAALFTPDTQTKDHYLAFATGYLAKPGVLRHLDLNTLLDSGFAYEKLVTHLNQANTTDPGMQDQICRQRDNSLWLLAHLIYLQGQKPSPGEVKPDGLDASNAIFHIEVVSEILMSQGIEIRQRLDIPQDSRDPKDARNQRRKNWRNSSALKPLPPFVRDQILTLLHRDTIVGMMDKLGEISAARPGQNIVATSAAFAAFATFVLTLIRIVPPQRVIDVRMLLYEGSTKMKMRSRGDSAATPALVHFWHMARATDIFQQIHRDHRNVVLLLKPFLTMANSLHLRHHVSSNTDDFAKPYNRHNKDWTILLLFLEIYTFAVKMMDDEEFLAGSQSDNIHLRSANTVPGNARRGAGTGALHADDIRTLVVFLKNFASALYWNPKLAGTMDDPRPNDSGPNGVLWDKNGQCNRLGRLGVLSGLLADPNAERSPEAARSHLRDMVTALLRAIHQWDARRKFFEEDFWLMGSQDNLAAFVPTVVAEEKKRQEMMSDSEDGDEEISDFDDDDEEDGVGDLEGHLTSSRGLGQMLRFSSFRSGLVSAREHRTRITAPRLEILRNLPFFVSFETRVQIFREFVSQDQSQRRHGRDDLDAWRIPAGFHSMSRHRAVIDRNRIFGSAFDELYKLEEGLKEPLQVSFIDQFGTAEAGIDGGGVMKEFLTSVTKEALDPNGEERLFAANEQNLLYPNPGKLDGHIETLRRAGVPDNSPQMEASVRDVLQRYRFLGRIVGKCLYEGVLIDATFAGYFLLRWALAGGTTSAARESGYQVTVDDVRDLDEDLYQGLLQLKHYDGDVEADFGLNFTVVDTFDIVAPTADDPHRMQTKSITRQLMANGASIPVTNSNRPLYISLLADHRLRRQSSRQTQAFLSGLGEIIPPMWLSMFNQSELQRLVGGDSQEIDLADLRANTVYLGVYAPPDPALLQMTEAAAGPPPREEEHSVRPSLSSSSSLHALNTSTTTPQQHHPHQQQQQQKQPNPQSDHETIQLFWQVLESMSNSDRRKLLKFVTSTPRAPLLGFEHLSPPFTIRDSADHDEGGGPGGRGRRGDGSSSGNDGNGGGNGSGRLPSTSTCVNLLKLPRYKSAEVMREKLLYAVNSGAGFDLS